MQTEVKNKQALGVNGVIAEANGEFLATIGGVLVADTTIGKPVGFGTGENEFINTGLTADKFVGFVTRTNFISSDNTPIEAYKGGDSVIVITQGNLYVKTPAIATQGQYVNCSADGVISFSDSATAPSGSFATGWRVKVGGAVGEVIEITTALK